MWKMGVQQFQIMIKDNKRRNDLKLDVGISIEINNSNRS